MKLSIGKILILTSCQVSNTMIFKIHVAPYVFFGYFHADWRTTLMTIIMVISLITRDRVN